MKVDQFRYGGDNFAYVASSNGMAVAIDPGAVTSVLSHLKSEGLTLISVANTHSHPDHVTGTQEVLDATGAQFLDNRSLRKKEFIRVGDETLQVIHTPGHTHDSLCFYAPGYVISGDTLFNGTVGNCFTGDSEAFYRSIKSLMALPKDTVIYAGHDYVEESIAFARRLEPENPDLDAYLKLYDSRHVFSTLEWELKVNPFLRFNAPELIEVMKAKELPTATEFDRWDSIMHIG